MISRVQNRRKNAKKGQTALEYALVVTVMAVVATFTIWVSQILVGETVYGSQIKNEYVQIEGLEGVVFYPYP